MLYIVHRIHRIITSLSVGCVVCNTVLIHIPHHTQPLTLSHLLMTIHTALLFPVMIGPIYILNTSLSESIHIPENSLLYNNVQVSLTEDALKEEISVLKEMKELKRMKLSTSLEG